MDNNNNENNIQEKPKAKVSRSLLDLLVEQLKDDNWYSLAQKF